MTFKELKTISKPHFYCLRLDKFFPKIARSILRKGAALGALLSFALSFDIMPLYFGKADGLFFLFIFIYLFLSFLEFFYKSMHNEGLQTRINEDIVDKNKNLDYTLSDLLHITNEIDATLAVLESEIGLKILMRSGIDPKDFKNFIASDRSPVMVSSLNLPSGSVNLFTYMEALYDADKSFQSFLARNSINKIEFIRTVTWIMEMEEKKCRQERFWSKENLGAIPSIGTNWSYGIAYDLGKFGIPFEKTVDISLFDVENDYRNKEVSALEMILGKGEEANAMIIDDDEKTTRDIIGRLLRKIRLGTSLPSIEHKQIIELDSNALAASYKNKTELESELLKILNQCISAGNIILFIKDLSGFITSSKNLGANLGSLLSPYLSSNKLHVLTSVTNADFRFFIESNPTFLDKFERIIPSAAGIPATVNVLLEQAPSIERQHGFMFSYPAILTIANSADRFLTHGEMPGKALDMMIKVALWAADRKISILKEGDIDTFITEKTRIATEL